VKNINGNSATVRKFEESSQNDRKSGGIESEEAAFFVESVFEIEREFRAIEVAGKSESGKHETAATGYDRLGTG
jgi:hypothetical protein